MRRATFVGVVIAVKTDVTGALPKPTDPVEVYRSPKLSVLLAARMLAQACERVLTKLAMEEKRKGEGQ
jgi:hypothetical protein